MPVQRLQHCCRGGRGFSLHHEHLQARTKSGPRRAEDVSDWMFRGQVIIRQAPIVVKSLLLIAEYGAFLLEASPPYDKCFLKTTPNPQTLKPKVSDSLSHPMNPYWNNLSQTKTLKPKTQKPLNPKPQNP